MQRYECRFENVAVSAVQDLFELVAGTNNSVIMRRLALTASKTSIEFLRLEFVKGLGAVTAGTGGSTPTIHKKSQNVGTAQAVVKANNTTRMLAGSGTLAAVNGFFWNLQVQFEWAPLDPTDSYEVKGTDRFSVGLASAPSASVQMSGVLVFDEVG